MEEAPKGGGGGPKEAAGSRRGVRNSRERLWIRRLGPPEAATTGGVRNNRWLM